MLQLLLDGKHFVIIGDNTVGKTTILEAIRVLSLGRTSRSYNVDTLLRRDKTSGYISIIYEDEIEKRTHTLISTFTSQSKAFSIDGEKLHSISSLLGHLPTTFFDPYTAFFFKKNPSNRRRLIDETISQYDNEYLYALKDYSKLLINRNDLLKKRESPDMYYKMIDVLTDEMIKKSFVIECKRRKFISELSSKMNDIYNRVFLKKKKSLRLEFKSSCPIIDIKEEYIKSLKNLIDENKSVENLKSTSIIGPHRDDIICYLNENDISSFGSQAENRMASLAIKLAVNEILTEKLHQSPILLLDDLLSDFDVERIDNLLSYLSTLNSQVFITSTKPRKEFDNYQKIDLNLMLK